jgi:REP element-mobilizing transposase RayT
MPQRFRVYEGRYPHHITSAVTHWLPIFSRDDYFRILADSLCYCADKKGLLVHAYVLMPTHFHIIASQVDGLLAEVIRDLKGYTSRQLGPKLEEDGRVLWAQAMRGSDQRWPALKVWQDGYYPEELHSEAWLKQKLDYVHDNPRRAGYVDDPCQWRYSSAGFYYRDGPSVVPVTPVDW